MFTRPVSVGFVRLIGLIGAGHSASSNTDECVQQASNNDYTEPHDRHESIKQSTQLIQRHMLEAGSPGLTINVSVAGRTMFRAAFGYCDVENLVPCEPDCMMRIGSISKAIFAATMVAPLVEANKVSLDDSVHKFLQESEFPKKTYDGKPVDITLAQLLSHKSGIRHYHCEDEQFRPIGSPNSKKIYQSREQYDRVEFFQRHTFRNTTEALAIFKDDPLSVKPGEFHYSTYNYTLLSAVVERVLQDQMSKEAQIEDHWMTQLQRIWKLENTRLDQDETIIPKRAKFYSRSAKFGALINAPYSDSSYKWAGGGLISNTDDLVRFANLLIASYKGQEGAIVCKETIRSFWNDGRYALGFVINRSVNDELIVSHSGDSAGACSILMIYPDSEIVVAIIVNLSQVNLIPLARSIADIFKNRMNVKN